MAGLGERVAPRRLGGSFRWLLGSFWTSNLGDGFALAAGPLLVARETRDASLVALATLLQRLPWLIFAFPAGVVTDRLNRSRLVSAVDLIRSGIVALLAVSILTHSVSIAVILVALFLLGTAEVFTDTAAPSLVPTLVHRDDLVVANARVQAGLVGLYQLAGPPIGAGLFALGVSFPFIGQAVLVAAGAVVMLKVRVPPREEERAPTRPAREVVEGLRFVIHHGAVRTLTLTIFLFNVTFGAAWSVLVLYAEERLHMGAIGFGVLTTASAIGGVAGTVGYGWLTKRVSLGNIMRVGLIIETFTHLSLALTTVPVVAVAIMVVFGAHAFVWGTTSVTVRQRAVPLELQGRVASVNGLGVMGGLVIGAAIGGPIADRWGVTAPFWFGFIGSALLVVLLWRQLSLIAHDEERQES